MKNVVLVVVWVISAVIVLGLMGKTVVDDIARDHVPVAIEVMSIERHTDADKTYWVVLAKGGEEFTVFNRELAARIVPGKVKAVIDRQPPLRSVILSLTK